MVLADDRSVAGPHAVAVVLTNEQDWKIPQLGHVVRFEDLSLIGRAIPVQCNADIVRSLILHCECDSGTERNLGEESQPCLRKKSFFR